MKGVSRQAIGDLVARKIIPLIDGKIDPSIADLKIGERLDPARAKTLKTDEPATHVGKPHQNESEPEAGAPITSFQVARTIREAAEARRAQLNLQRALREVVDREGVELAAMEVARMMRDSLMGAAVRIGPGLVGITDPGEMVQRLEKEMRTVLESAQKTLSASMQRMDA